MDRLIIRASCILLIALLVQGCCHKGARQIVPEPGTAELHVVESWDDLMKQPIVGTGDQAVHVGIEARSCAADTGILVYCIPVDQSGSRQITERLHNPLGPAAIKVIPLDRREPQVKYALEKIKEPTPARETPVFFAAGATVDTAGRYEVQVVDQDDKILAKTTIVAAKSERSPWLTFDAGDLEKQPGANHYAPSTIAARPHWDGSVAMNKSDRLPPFFAQKEYLNLDVSVHSGLVTVKIDQDAEEFLPENWLVRWWVNGKPVLGKFGPRTSPRMMRNEGRRMLDTGEFMTFSFHLDIDRKKLGATPKDRLEFQLLYCRDGVDFIHDEEIEEINMWNPNAAPACLSKRILWQP